MPSSSSKGIRNKIPSLLTRSGGLRKKVPSKTLGFVQGNDFSGVLNVIARHLAVRRVGIGWEI